MAYPKKTVAFSDVKRIINEEFKMAIEDIKTHITLSHIQKDVIRRIRNLRDNLLDNIEEEIL